MKAVYLVLMVILGMPGMISAQVPGMEETVLKVLGDPNGADGLEKKGLYNSRVNRKQINLLDYGAMPGDDSEDNCQAIKNAIGDAVQEGIAEILVSGMFYTSQVVVNNRSNISFIGSGPKSGFRSLIDLSLPSENIQAIFKLIDCSSIEFRGLRFELNAADEYPDVVCPIWIDGSNGTSEHFRIRDCQFIDSGPIYFFNENPVSSPPPTIKHVRINRCDFYPQSGIAGKAGIDIESDLQNARIANCNYYGAAQGAHFIQSSGGHYLQISRCYVEKTAFAAMSFSSGPLNISGCTIFQPGGDAIELFEESPNPPLSAATIANNTIIGAGRDHSQSSRTGLDIRADDVIIANNIISALENDADNGYASGSTEYPMTGVFLNGRQIMLQNNIFQGFNGQVSGSPGETAVEIGDEAEIVMVQENQIYEWGNALLAEGDFSDLIIKGNTIRDIDDAAVHMPVNSSAVREKLYILSNNLANIDGEGWLIEDQVTDVVIQHNTGIEVNEELQDLTNLAGDIVNHNDHEVGGDHPFFKLFQIFEMSIGSNDVITKIEKISNGNGTTKLVITVGGDTYEIPGPF